MQIPSEPDMKNVGENLEAMNRFAEKHDTKINAMIVPNAAFVMQDYLPSGAPVRDQGRDMKNIRKQLSEKIGFIDVTKTCLQQHIDEGMYYKTDDHGPARRQSTAFRLLLPGLGLKIRWMITQHIR